MEVELCACGHANDHLGRQCGHNAVAAKGKCPYQFGQRVDVALFRVTVEQNELLAATHSALMRLLSVMEHATSLQTRVVDAGEGRQRVDVQPRKATPSLILPR